MTLHICRNKRRMKGVRSTASGRTKLPAQLYLIIGWLDIGWTAILLFLRFSFFMGHAPLAIHDRGLTDGHVKYSTKHQNDLRLFLRVNTAINQLNKLSIAIRLLPNGDRDFRQKTTVPSPPLTTSFSSTKATTAAHFLSFTWLTRSPWSSSAWMKRWIRSFIYLVGAKCGGKWSSPLAGRPGRSTSDTSQFATRSPRWATDRIRQWFRPLLRADRNARFIISVLHFDHKFYIIRVKCHLVPNRAEFFIKNIRIFKWKR